LNAQRVRAASAFTYHGGRTPLRHRLERRALDAARRACEIFPGLRGYVGVDLVLTESEVFVIEVNPRLTTAYLGVRAVAGENVAALALKACAGRLPRKRFTKRTGVRFSADGRVAS
jgi:predicted ATP-grasp superfamily ATP-dependent carboligase